MFFFFFSNTQWKVVMRFPVRHLLGLAAAAAAATVNTYIQLFACGFQFKYNLISTCKRAFDTLAYIYTFGWSRTGTATRTATLMGLSRVISSILLFSDDIGPGRVQGKNKNYIYRKHMNAFIGLRKKYVMRGGVGCHFYFSVYICEHAYFVFIETWNFCATMRICLSAI